MAKLSAHGYEVGRIEYPSWAKTYHSDGTVLINRGDGWKVHGKVKANFTPTQAYEHVKSVQAARLADNPMYAQWYKLIMGYGLVKRQYIIMTIETMPEDPDGVWCELTDTYDYRAKMNWEIEEVIELCRAYNLAVEEANGKLN